MKCLPGQCEHLRVDKEGENRYCYCKKLKRRIGSDELIEYPEGCPYNE